MKKVLFTSSNQSMWIEMLHSAKNNFDSLNFLADFVVDEKHEENVVSRNFLSRRIDLRRRINKSKDQSFRTESYDHIHYFDHMAAINDLFRRHNSTYSVTCGRTWLQFSKENIYKKKYSSTELEKNIANELMVLRRAEFVDCTSEWVRKSLIQEAGIHPDRLHLSKMILDYEPKVKQYKSAKWLTYVADEGISVDNSYVIDLYKKNFQENNPLHIIDPDGNKNLEMKGVHVHLFMNSKRFLDEILPNTRVLLAPYRSLTSQLPIIQSASVGVPVVAYREADFPELIMDGESGFLISPYSQKKYVSTVSDLLSNDEKIKQINKKSVNYYKKSLSSQNNNHDLIIKITNILNGERAKRRTLINSIDGVDYNLLSREK